MPQELSEMRKNIYLLKARFKDLFDYNDDDLNKFINFSNALQSVSEITEKYYTTDENWEYPKVTEESLVEIQNQYKKLLDACFEASALAKDTDKYFHGDTLVKIIEDVTTLATRDLSALQVVRLDEETTLPEIIFKARSYTAGIGDGALPTNHYDLHRHYHMMFEKGDAYTSGYFIPAGSNEFSNKHILTIVNNLSKEYRGFNIVLDKIKALDISMLDPANPNKLTIYDDISIISQTDNNGQPDPAVEELRQKYLNAYHDVMAELKTDDQRQRFLEEKINEELTDLRFKKELEALNIPDDQITALLSKDGAKEFLISLGTELNKVVTEKVKYDNSKKRLGLNPNADVDKRNIAVSSIAKLLGKAEIVPESHSVILVQDNKNIAGTFVESPPGIISTDIPDYQTAIKDYDANHYNNPSVFDNISALQALDFICGTLNRQPATMMMNFDQEQKLVSVKGIHNEFSFGTQVPNANEAGYNGSLITPTQMGVIGKQTAEAITALTEETISFALKGYGLSEEEIHAAWERTKMQQEIEKGIQHYKESEKGILDKGFLRVVPENEWDSYQLSQLAEIGDNQFKVISNMNQIIKDNDAQIAHTKDLRKKSYSAMRVAYPKENPSAEDAFVATAIGNGMGNINEIGIKLTPAFKIATDENDPLPQVAGTKTVRYGIQFEENGQPLTGFFTPLTEVNSRKEKHRIMNDLISLNGEYEEELEQMRQHIIGNPDSYSKVMHSLSLDGRIPYEEMGFSEEKSNELRNDPKFTEILKDLKRRVSMSEKNLEDYQEFGVDINSSIDQRNVAMSNVAALCGAPNLLAKSYNVQLQAGNRIVNGVFMETAKGVDVFRLKKDDPILNYDDSVFDNGAGLKSLAELQILDYLCMNMDRHEGNMLYQFSDNPQHKFIGVIGIDNDYSFGTRDPKGKVAYCVTSLNEIEVISERMAQNILEITPEHLGQTLKEQKIGANEIVAAQERLGRLQSRIQNEAIKIVKDDEWDNYTLNELAGENGRNNIFNRVKNHTKDLKNKAKNARDNNLPYNDNLKPIEYKKVNKVDEFRQDIVDKQSEKQAATEEGIKQVKEQLKAKEEAIKKAKADLKTNITDFINGRATIPILSNEDLFKEAASAIKNLNELLEDADPAYIRSSKEFRQLKKKAKEMNTFVKNIETDPEYPGIPSDREMDQIINDLKVLNTKVAEYVTYKVATVHDDETKFNSLETKRVLSARTSGALATSVLQIHEHNAYLKHYKKDRFALLSSGVLEQVSVIQQSQNNPERLKEAVAKRLYYSALSNTGVKNDATQLQTALLPENFEKGVEKIKQTKAFQQLMKNTPVEIIDMVANEFDERLYNSYIRLLAAHPDAPQAAANDNNVANPQNVNNGPGISH